MGRFVDREIAKEEPEGVTFFIREPSTPKSLDRTMDAEKIWIVAKINTTENAGVDS